MRAIKFRGKRVDNGEWVYGGIRHYYTTVNLTEVNKWFIIHESDIYGNQVDPATVGQFTGLVDKDGNEIYEGDWCRAKFLTKTDCQIIQGKIMVDEFMWCIDCIGSVGGDVFSINRPHNFEVLGNIHDNPQLIEGGNK